MACADISDNLRFVAAALSAMTDKHIVSKSEYLTIQQQTQSGINTGYTFQGKVDVPQVIKQTYADTYQLVTQLQSSTTADTVDDTPTQVGRSPWFQFTSMVAEYFSIGGESIDTGEARAGIELTTLAAVSDCEGVTLNHVENEMGHGHKETEPSTVVEDQMHLVNNEPVQIFISSSDGIGVDICIMMSSNKNTVHQLKLRIEQRLRIKTEDQCLSYQGTLLQDTHTLHSYHIINNSTLTLSVRVRGGSTELHYLDATYMDPTWDYDFTNVSDGNTKFTRGGHRYYRPCGWKRIAINVTDRYGDNTWLGHTNSRGEWAVSYHGTKQPVFDKICEEGYKVGPSNAHGDGVYSSPYISEAERYASEFNYEGVRYLGVFQNRVNPKSINIVNNEKYWVCPNPANIRPYGLCVKPC